MIKAIVTQLNNLNGPHSADSGC